MRRLLIGPVVAISVGLCALVVGGGIADALIPDANGTLHACLKKQGDAYVIDPSAGQTCGKDTPLDWNKTGVAGAQGTIGPEGTIGPKGATGISGYEQQSTQFTTDGSGSGSGETDCSAGKVALAGGYELTTSLIPLHSAPNDDGTGWVVGVTGAANAAFLVSVICATNGGA